MGNIFRIFMLLAVFTVVYGCGPVISKETLKQVDRNVTFEEVSKNPTQFIGKKVAFGGTIINTENEENRTLIEVLQEGLDYRLKPVEPAESAGRFLVAFDGFKDPAIYSKGKRITIAGTITGVEDRKLGQITYKYPVIKPDEHRLWIPRTYEREPSIGIGIGLGYTHID
ncbi:MAG: Slp family lipoprotein [Deltaproteobacteria bacterium]|nr:Slp family lipoprotein [Deltaproteobacteria bacterium]